METLNQIQYVHIEHVMSPYLIIKLKLYKWELHGMTKTEFLVYLYVTKDSSSYHHDDDHRIHNGR